MDKCPTTPFEQAWKEYVDQLSPKKKQRRFLMNCARALQENSDNSPASAINEAISAAEKKHSMQTSRRMIRKYIDPVVNVLRDFDAIICTLVSADPMPTAIIWGALKVIIDGLSRFSSLFDTIKNELRSLRDQLEHITDYENLYGKDGRMQKLLCQSYFNIIRFWHRVDKECDNCGFAILKTVAPFSTKKLNSIIEDMQHDSQEISKRASMIQAIDFKGEQAENAMARQEAADERRKAEEERRAQHEFREEKRRDAPRERFDNLCKMLSSSDICAADVRRREKHFSGTCEWLLDHPDFVAWATGASSSRVLWIHGPPGSGKSTLCSRVSQILSSRSDTVASHFCDFAQQYKPFEVLRMLALQLLCKHWKDENNIPQELCDVAQATASALENVQNMIKVLVKVRQKVFFLIDGLDEEITGERWRDTVDVVQFLIQLTKEFPAKVHIWCSSQPRPLIRKELDGCTDFDISAYVKKDIAIFLSKAIPEAGELELLDQENFLQDLQQRAECSFLWASLMIGELQGSPTSLREMKQFIERGLPTTLIDYYSLFFKRFKKSLRPLARKLFALIVFARRPLKLSELQEAIWCLNSKSHGYLNPEDKPFLDRLHEVSQPLVEMTKVTGPQAIDGQEEYICRLFHSTLRDFLVKNPDILSEAGDPLTDLHISPYVAVDACLTYLSQARYTELLVRREGRWIDGIEELVDNHKFLIYAAKYWDKHLDDAAEEHREELLGRLQTFITSSNFQTCIQVQSLWVELQFCTFRICDADERYRFLRRVFPLWFSQDTEVGAKLWQNYRCFLHEWKHFLSCGNCHMVDPKCRILPYLGQLDRIWFGALGPSNFLSQLKSRYTSFIFRTEDGHQSGHWRLFDGVANDGGTLMMLRIEKKLSKGDSEILQFSCETWSLSGQQLPVREKCQVILESPELCDWPLYVDNVIHQSLQIGKASPAAFSADCQTLRIGTRIFVNDSAGNFVALPRLTLLAKSPPYVEEFCRRGRFIVLASRTRLSATDVSSDEPLDTAEENCSQPATTTEHESDSEDDSDDESTQDSSTESEIGMNSEDEGYESWSDSSTVFSEDYVFDDDMITPWADHLCDKNEASDSGTDSEADEDPTGSDSSDDDEDLSTAESGSSGDDDIVPPSAFGYGKAIDEDEYDWDEDYSSRSKRNKHDAQQARATITIFDAQASPDAKAVRLFHLTRPLQCKVYGSPPIIHPTRPLVIWPLGAGDVLFVDFKKQSYFVRRLRPSTLHTRHIFMKCQFSACGRFLHIVALEGQQATKPKHSADKSEKDAINIAVLVSTYRLSQTKTSRSPPTLIHRIRVKLGSTESLSVTKLPFTVTWNANDVYITCSDTVLRVYRVPLFKPEIGTREDENIVLMPRKPVFLPESALNRQVHYFPGKSIPDGRLAARIIIGSETRKQLEEKQGPKHDDEFCAVGRTFVGQEGECSLPIGCYVNEDIDLGGWGKSYDTTEIPGQLGIGCLDRRLERFNFDDDCDLEPYVY